STPASTPSAPAPSRSTRTSAPANLSPRRPPPRTRNRPASRSRHPEAPPGRVGFIPTRSATPLANETRRTTRLVLRIFHCINTIYCASCLVSGSLLGSTSGEFPTLVLRLCRGKGWNVSRTFRGDVEAPHIAANGGRIRRRRVDRAQPPRSPDTGDGPPG